MCGGGLAFGEIIKPKAAVGSSGSDAITHSCFGAGSSIKDGNSNLGFSGLLFIEVLGLFATAGATAEGEGSNSDSATCGFYSVAWGEASTGSS